MKIDTTFSAPLHRPRSSGLWRASAGTTPATTISCMTLPRSLRQGVRALLGQSGKLLRKRRAAWFASNEQADRLHYQGSLSPRGPSQSDPWACHGGAQRVNWFHDSLPNHNENDTGLQETQPGVIRETNPYYGLQIQHFSALNESLVNDDGLTPADTGPIWPAALRRCRPSRPRASTSSSRDRSDRRSDASALPDSESPDALS